MPPHDDRAALWAFALDIRQRLPSRWGQGRHLTADASRVRWRVS